MVEKNDQIHDARCEGETMHTWATELFPIMRSITGPGLRSTLNWIENKIDGFKVHSVSSGSPAFDWVVPLEWRCQGAWIEDADGCRIIDASYNNLHVIGYSAPINHWVTRQELEEHLYSLPEQPHAIPYVTSYYQTRWGFCLNQKQRESLNKEKYKAVINSEFVHGELNYGEVFIKGDSAKEIFISTYVCHPSMANNELSGPVVTTALCQWLAKKSELKYTYRIVFVPETIGSLVYLSKNLDDLKKNVIAGFNVTCIGDDRCYSFLPSRDGKTLADRAARHVLKHIDPSYASYTWLQRGSDERQYCAPGVDLPVATIMRSKYGTYPEYHTSLDDLSLVTPSGLAGGLNALKAAIEAIEHNSTPTTKVLGEPQLGRRNLYPTLSIKGSSNDAKLLIDVQSLSDGQTDLIGIADILGKPISVVAEAARLLAEHEIISLHS